MSATSGEHPQSSGRQRSLLISLHPRFAEPILDGSASTMVRRTRIGALTGSLLILYATAPTKAVVGLATVRRGDTDLAEAIWCRYEHSMALCREEFDVYLAGARQATVLVLTAARRLSLPCPLGVLRLRDGAPFSPPPNYRYLTPTDPDTLHQLASAGRPPNPLRTG